LIEKVNSRYGKFLGKITVEYSDLRMNAVASRPSLRTPKDLSNGAAVEETKNVLE
jgi:hypothetical protein